MTLIYPGLSGRPVILVNVVCLLTGRQFLVPMILDTGADATCFPAKFAAFFGHDNHHPQVAKSTCRGVGGTSVTYLHSLQLRLIDPNKSSSTRHVIAWAAKPGKTAFVEKLDCETGLLGMDVMRSWKQVAFRFRTTGPQIHIEL